jgi:hypothetical protein
MTLLSVDGRQIRIWVGLGFLRVYLPKGGSIEVDCLSNAVSNSQVFHKFNGFLQFCLEVEEWQNAKAQSGGLSSRHFPVCRPRCASISSS